MDKLIMMLKDAAMYTITNAPKVIGGVALGTVTYRFTDSTYDDVQLWNAERKLKNLREKRANKEKALKEGKSVRPSAPRPHKAKSHEAHAPA